MINYLLSSTFAYIISTKLTFLASQRTLSFYFRKADWLMLFMENNLQALRKSYETCRYTVAKFGYPYCYSRWYIQLPLGFERLNV
jgi:Protein involved in chromosome segregation, interacts with SMC proteins